MTDFYLATPDEQAERLTDLARRALPHWGLSEQARVELIKHRENAVFSVTDGDDRVALRVHRAGYHSDAELRSELQWIAAIDGDGLRTPQVIPTTDGELFVRVEAPSVPEARQVDVLEWFEGEPLGSVEDGVDSDPAETFHVVGALMATTHNHSETWQLPEGFERHSWDEEGILGDEPLWGRYLELEQLDDGQRALLGDVKTKALDELARFGKASDRYGLIHADFQPENLLRSDAGICLIDFDDAGFGWHVFDIATALFFHLGEPSFEPVSEALIGGYRSKRALPDEHLEQLPLFFLLRGLTYLGWSHTRRETETARELTPMVVAGVDELARAYLA